MSVEANIPKRIAITGTPGSGKSSLSEILGTDYVSLEVKELSKEYGCISLSENDNNPSIIDIDELTSILSKDWEKPPTKSILVVGHLSHLLPVDAIIILRCNPLVLESRLKERNWNEEKVVSNVEWEMMGGPWQELLELDNLPNCMELDNTIIDITQQKEAVCDWIEDNCPPIHSISNIDWISELHE